MLQVLVFFLNFRRTQLIYSLHKPGKTIVWDCQRTWLANIDCWKLIGWKTCGGRTRFSKTPNLLRFKQWPFLITTCGFTKTKQSCTWSSKGFVYLSPVKTEFFVFSLSDWPYGFLVLWILWFTLTTLKSVSYKWNHVRFAFFVKKRLYI